MDASLSTSITAVAALEDELRGAMYFYIRRARRPITRDEAAASVGISRKLAAFHLDKLVDVGLLRADYQPLPGTRRVGRTPKVYRPTELEIRVAIPRRSRDVLTEILLETVLTGAKGEQARDAAVRVARELGERACLPDDETAPARAERFLEEHGYEPEREPGRIRLRNCPFHPLTTRSPELVCRLNHAFLSGCVEGTGMRAVLSPQAGECCVELRPVQTTERDGRRKSTRSSEGPISARRAAGKPEPRLS
ncbi:transcriptional regulator [Amycolatopsis sp.]|uniref:helix-turn-helix transcriptional regulator n=1 Tax=Amycolatopsis sp. TaxID=37632 RepID=UPI002C0F3D50|nr:transcriptional regulator [Amycolatopsis sp.]HVV09798.1 transcriptional regulator [Amycolatopsis sp.]